MAKKLIVEKSTDVEQIKRCLTILVDYSIFETLAELEVLAAYADLPIYKLADFK